VLIGAVAYTWYERNFSGFNIELPENWQVCQNDFDCVETQKGCCNCGNGGVQTSVNKNYLASWEDKISKACGQIACPAVVLCREGQSVCKNKQCVFEYDEQEK
jgi:hypothetical protein